MPWSSGAADGTRPWVGHDLSQAAGGAIGKNLKPFKFRGGVGGMARPVSLRDIAEAAQVSVGTVSQSLRGDSRTAAVTAARVRRLAEELGYRPDPVLSSIASRGFRRDARSLAAVIWFVTGLDDPEQFRVHRFAPDLRAECGRLGYLFDRKNASSPEELQTLLRQAWQCGVRGVVFGLFDHLGLLPRVSRELEPFAVAQIGDRCERHLTPVVKSATAEGFDGLLRRVLAVEEGRIGVVLSTHPGLDLPDDFAREAVYFHHRRRSPGRFVSEFAMRFGDSFGERSRQLGEWFREHRPDVVIAYAVGRRMLEVAGVRHGRDCVLVDFGGLPKNAPPGPSLMEDESGIAAATIRLLDSMIRHGERGLGVAPCLHLLPMRWVPGASPPNTGADAGAGGRPAVIARILRQISGGTMADCPRRTADAG